VERIASRRNPLVLRYRAASSGDNAALLLDGPHLVHEALAAGVSIRSAIVADEVVERDEFKRLVSWLTESGADVVAAPRALVAAASPVQSPSPVVALADRPSVPPDAPYLAAVPFVLIACAVQDPGNLGAIVRVAEAAGASGVVAAGPGADPFGWKALRGSMGSALRLPIVTRSEAREAFDEARQHRCRVIAAVPRAGTSLFEADLTGPVAILVGGEGPGLDAALSDDADVRVTIPMQAPVESLNAAVAAALIAYEVRRQRQPLSS
jgi:TrmH family RNA methyltransferase